VANLAQVLAVGTEFKELSGGCSVRRASHVAAAEYKDMSLGVDGNSANFSEIEIGGKFEKVRHGIEWDFGNALLRKQKRGAGEQ